MLRHIGSGTQASVREAERPDGTRVAVKAYRLDTFGRAFRREAAVLYRHRGHPHFVRMLEAFSAGGKGYIVEELVRGPDLQCFLGERGPLPVPLARGIARSILQALAELHAAGTVHRDVKPANVLVRDPAFVAESLCLADFGSAHVGDVAGSSPEDSPVLKITTDGMTTIAGTPYYLAPELVRGEAYDSGVDIWALGCLVWQVLTGETPFQSSRTFEELYTSIATTDPEFPSCMDEPLRSFLSCLLERDPAGRAAAAAALAHPWLALDTQPHTHESPSGDDLSRADSSGWIVCFEDGELRLAQPQSADISEELETPKDSGYFEGEGDVIPFPGGSAR
ncbi:kinase-like domain-containing protein [Hyaloraphidium curvatum]|nr:kinase-like domain-containing protein [Hyaloraphidium curvatum]